MRFTDSEKGVTPILSAVPPPETVQEGDPSPRGGNPEVREAVAAKKPQHLAWAFDRPDGGRGFGFTGLHLHENLHDDNFRQVLINAVAWVAGLEVPEGGVPTEQPSKEELEQLIVEARQAIKDGR
jgi:hypothetical protein